MSWDVGAWVINTLSKLITNNIIDNHGKQEFTSSGTFIVPANVHWIYITACAGGAGGNTGWDYTTDYSCHSPVGGNGGEAIMHKKFSVVPGQSIPITIGNGGAGGVTVDSKNATACGGQAGGNTIIGSLVTLAGGPESLARTKASGHYLNCVHPTVRPGAGHGGKVNETNGAEVGATGVFASGGANGIDYREGGGGGGSLGPGGGGSMDANSFYSPGYGGGGYGNRNGYNAGAGGKGYCLIEW